MKLGKTKEQMRSRGSAILAAHHPGESIVGDDFDFLLSLLNQHPNAIEKIGPGVRAIMIRSAVARYGPGKCFEVVRVDGSREDFSYLKCLNVRNSRTDLAHAFREAVRDQTELVRDRAFSQSDTIVCPITGDVVASSQADVDHAAPLTFERLVSDFLQSRGLQERDVRVVMERYESRLEDESFRSDWIEYHREHAQLRVVSAKANRGVLRRRSYNLGGAI